MPRDIVNALVAKRAREEAGERAYIKKTEGRCFISYNQLYDAITYWASSTKLTWKKVAEERNLGIRRLMLTGSGKVRTDVYTSWVIAHGGKTPSEVKYAWVKRHRPKSEIPEYERRPRYIVPPDRVLVAILGRWKRGWYGPLKQSVWPNHTEISPGLIGQLLNERSMIRTRIELEYADELSSIVGRGPLDSKHGVGRRKARRHITDRALREVGGATNEEGLGRRRGRRSKFGMGRTGG